MAKTQENNEQSKKLQLAGDWYLGADSFNLVLYKRRVIAKGGNAGQEDYDPMGYYASLEGVMKGLLRYISVDTLMQTDANTLEEYIAELNEKVSQIRIMESGMLAKIVKQVEVNT